MPTVTVYGHSDDLIEVEGAITEEFPATDDGQMLAFSDGTLLRVVYDNDGIWRITTIVIGNGSTVHLAQATVDSDDCYSDRLELTASSLTWCLHGRQIALA